MVSSYFLVKLFKKSTYERIKRNVDGVGENSKDTSTTSRDGNENKCRICLKEGTIPIYGDDNTPDISVAIRTFGDIELKEDDNYPKHLCIACYHLLQGAIQFRKTAKQSYQILRKRQVKQELKSDNSLDSDGNYSPVQKVKVEKQKNSSSSSLLKKFFSVIVSDNDEINGNKAILKTKKKISKVQCRICFKIITKAYYKEHFALHDPTITKYMCDVCGKSFRQRCAYRNHYFTHSTEFPYKCKICPYRGRNSGLLKTHMRTHTGDYRYMCTECPARFLTKSNLNKHMLKHKEPTFKCDTCKKAFHSRLNLDRHFEAEHLGIRNHICNLCGKAFGYRKAMMRHQLDVHKREKKLNGRTPAYLEAEMKNRNNI